MTPQPDLSGSWLRRRGVDIAVWLVVVLAMIGLAAGMAVYLSNIRFELREVPPADEEPLREGASADTRLPTPEAPTAVEGIANPTWVRQPSAAYPGLAMRAGVDEGAVSLTCVVEVSGRLADCRVVSEIPAGYGFGRSAIRGASRARVTPRTIDGVPMRSEVTFNMRFVTGP